MLALFASMKILTLLITETVYDTHRKRFILEVSFENQIKEHTQQTFVGLQDEDVLKTCLEDVFYTSSV